MAMHQICMRTHFLAMANSSSVENNASGRHEQKIVLTTKNNDSKFSRFLLFIVMYRVLLLLLLLIFFFLSLSLHVLIFHLIQVAALSNCQIGQEMYECWKKSTTIVLGLNDFYACRFSRQVPFNLIMDRSFGAFTAHGKRKTMKHRTFSFFQKCLCVCVCVCTYSKCDKRQRL